MIPWGDTYDAQINAMYDWPIETLREHERRLSNP